MDSNKKTKIIRGLVLLLIMLFAALFTYKAQIDDGFDKPFKDSWHWAHKSGVEGTIGLTVDGASIEEGFICTVDELHRILVYAQFEGEKGTAAKIDLSLLDLTTNNEIGVSDAVLSPSKDFTTLKMGVNNEGGLLGHELLLKLVVTDLQGGILAVKSNEKPGVVTSFYGDTNARTNIIYEIEYGKAASAKGFLVICLLLIVFLSVFSYYMFVIRGLDVQKAFIPLALVYGLVMMLVIPLNGVPDESWHMDTAYKYSNVIMGIGNPDQPGTIYKRKCDAVLTDMLPNNLETGSDYQSTSELFKRHAGKDLIVVNYFDSSRQVTFLNYLPAAVGLSIGRVFGLSPAFTYQLGRLMNLIVYVLLVALAICVTPLYKELIAMTALLPIMIQQAASFSYDPVVMGFGFLLIATCLYLHMEKSVHIKWYVICALLSLYMVFTKGAVYFPIALMVFAINRPGSLKLKLPKWAIAIGAVAVVAVVGALFVVKFMPILAAIGGGSNTGSPSGETITMAYILRNPLSIGKKAWRTFFDKSDPYIQGAFGGIFGWLDVKLVMMFPIANLIGLLLLSAVEESSSISGKMKKLLVAGSVISIGLIYLAMLLAETEPSDNHIEGVQGRYLVLQILMIFMAIRSESLKLKKEKATSVMTALMFINALSLMQVLGKVF